MPLVLQYSFLAIPMRTGRKPAQERWVGEKWVVFATCCRVYCARLVNMCKKSLKWSGDIETSLPHLNHSLRQSLWLHFHWHELILEMEKPFLLVLDLRNSKNTLKNTWKTIQLKSERMRVESSRCHTRSLQNRHRTSSYFVASLRVLANEARGRRRARHGRRGKV